MVIEDLTSTLNNATGFMSWYRRISEDYTALYTWDGQLQIHNFPKKQQIFMELCEEVTLLLLQVVVREDHLLEEAEHNVLL